LYFTLPIRFVQAQVTLNDLLNEKLKLFYSTTCWFTHCQSCKDYLLCPVICFTQI